MGAPLPLKQDVLAQHFSFMAYQRPPADKLVGSAAVDYLEAMVKGDTLGVQRPHGFVFLYELMTGGAPEGLYCIVVSKELQCWNCNLIAKEYCNVLRPFFKYTLLEPLIYGRRNIFSI